MADEIELSGWEWLSLVQGVQGVSDVHQKGAAGSRQG